VLALLQARQEERLAQRLQATDEHQ
jgi:hypothetical protein